jgi:hypothetical protein
MEELMNKIRSMALAITLLGGLALAATQSEAKDSKSAVKAANMCPAGACYWNGKCLKPCP